MLVSSITNNPQQTSQNFRIEHWLPDLEKDIVIKLKLFFELIHQQNKFHQFIPQKQISLIDEVYFYESIKFSQIVYKNNNKINNIYDIGSGYGFPGLIYGIVYPTQSIHLVEMDPRKCLFLDNVINQLKLINIKVLNQKIEDLPDYCIQYAILKNFSPLPRTLLTLRKLVKEGGELFHIKAHDWSLEISQLPSQLCSFWDPSLIEEFTLPISLNKISVIKTLKLSQ